MSFFYWLKKKIDYRTWEGEDEYEILEDKYRTLEHEYETLEDEYGIPEDEHRTLEKDSEEEYET